MKATVLLALVLLPGNNALFVNDGFPKNQKSFSRRQGQVRLQDPMRRHSSADDYHSNEKIQESEQIMMGNIDLPPSSRRNFFAKALAMSSIATLPATATICHPQSATAVDFSALDMPKLPGGAPNKGRIGGLANKIRNSCNIMDELQRDLMQEKWTRVESYPAQLRSYVPVFTAYTDSAFPSDTPTDKGLRVALRYEVGRFFGSVERFKQATNRRALDEAYVAFSDMSLHLDRYLRVGGLYTYYDDTITLEPYYKGISESALVYADPVKDQPEVRDLVIMVKGPDKGRTGIVIGIYRDGTNRTAVKLDRYKGMREIRVVPTLWVAKRLGEQDPDDVFLLPVK